MLWTLTRHTRDRAGALLAYFPVSTLPWCINRTLLMLPQLWFELGGPASWLVAATAL